MTSKAGMNSPRTVYYLLGTYEFSIPTCVGKKQRQEADFKPKCLLRVRWDETVCAQNRGLVSICTFQWNHRYHYHFVIIIIAMVIGGNICLGNKPFVIECLAVRRNQSGQLSIVWKLHVFMFLQPRDNLLSRKLVTFEFDDDVMCQAWYCQLDDNVKVYLQ